LRVIELARSRVASLRASPDQRDFLRAVCAVLLLNGGDSTAQTVMPVYLQQLGYAVGDIGLLVSGYAVASLLSRLPAGRLADSRRARLWFAVSCVVMALAMALYPLARVTWLFVVIRFVHGFAFGTATTINLAAVIGLGGKQRARALSVFAGSISGGFTIGNVLGGVLADNLGFNLTFWCAAAFPLLATLLGTRAGQSGATRRSVGGGWTTLLRRREVRGVLLLSLVINLLHQGWGTLFPLYVVSFGGGLTLAGLVRATHSTTNTIGRPLGEPVVRRYGATGLACFGLTLYAIGIAALPTTTVGILLVVLAAVIGLGRASAFVANVVTTAEISERGLVNRGTASALMNLGGDVGSITAPVLAGFVAQHLGIGPALQLLAVVVAGIGVAAVLASHTPESARAQPEVKAGSHAS
jgi:MFS family permease